MHGLDRLSPGRSVVVPNAQHALGRIAHRARAPSTGTWWPSECNSQQLDLVSRPRRAPRSRSARGRRPRMRQSFLQIDVGGAPPTRCPSISHQRGEWRTPPSTRSSSPRPRRSTPATPTASASLVMSDAVRASSSSSASSRSLQRALEERVRDAPARRRSHPPATGLRPPADGGRRAYRSSESARGPASRAT
jgi:hypothetical protein